MAYFNAAYVHAYHTKWTDRNITCLYQLAPYQYYIGVIVKRSDVKCHMSPNKSHFHPASNESWSNSMRLHIYATLIFTVYSPSLTVNTCERPAVPAELWAFCSSPHLSDDKFWSTYMQLCDEFNVHITDLSNKWSTGLWTHQFTASLGSKLANTNVLSGGFSSEKLSQKCVYCWNLNASTGQFFGIISIGINWALLYSNSWTWKTPR